MSALEAKDFPADAVRDRALRGTAATFPDPAGYGRRLFGATAKTEVTTDPVDALRLVPPVFVPRRMDKLVELAREPLYTDVVLDTRIGAFTSRLPLYVSAFGSTEVASTDLGVAASRQAGRLGVPLVIGENVVPVNGYGRIGTTGRGLLARIRSYADSVPDAAGGVVVQQSTEDADAEVWNLVYSDPSARPLLDSGRLGFELKVGQGAKPGLGGMTVLDADQAARIADRFALDRLFDCDDTDDAPVLRSASPGTFTDEILRQQIRLMRNNFPRASVWVKLPPGRDLAAAARVCWQAGADAVTVDGAEAGTGWAPSGFLEHVGLPLGECLRRIGPPAGCLLASGRMWEGTRAAKCLALGARAVGLGRAALLAVAADPAEGLVRLADCLALELRMLTSALGKYDTTELSLEDVWSPDPLWSPTAVPAQREPTR